MEEAHVRRVRVEAVRSPEDGERGQLAYFWRDARSSGLLVINPESGRVERVGPDSLDPDGFLPAALALREWLWRCGELPDRLRHDSADER